VEDVEATVARRVRVRLLHELALFAVARARLHLVGAPAVGDVVPRAGGEVATVPRPRRADRGLEQAEDPVTADEAGAVAGRRRLALLAVGGALVHHVVAAPPRRPERRVLGNPVAALPRLTSSSAAGETNRVGVGVAGSGGGGGGGGGGPKADSDDEHRRDDDGAAGAHAAALLHLSASPMKLSAS